VVTGQIVNFKLCPQTQGKGSCHGVFWQKYAAIHLSETRVVFPIFASIPQY
jgi:hypothetical protein